MSMEREKIKSMGGPKRRIIQAEPEHIFTLVAIGANGTRMPFPNPELETAYDILVKGAAIKPAEREQRKRLLKGGLTRISSRGKVLLIAE